MKNDRQSVILDIISNECVETQEQLMEALKARGYNSTQATISRDIHALHLVKESTGKGNYHYVVSNHRMKLSFADRLRTIFKEGVMHIDVAQNLVVLKTMPGLASAACSALDSMEIEYMAGSIAGDDTAVIIMKNNESAVFLADDIKEMLK